MECAGRVMHKGSPAFRSPPSRKKSDSTIRDSQAVGQMLSTPNKQTKKNN